MQGIAFIGTGLIGAGMAEGALRRGERVTVWNRTRSKAEALSSLGARVAADIPEAVNQTSRVHLALNDDAAVDGALAAMQGHLAPGTVVIDHSTTSPAQTKTRMDSAPARGIELLHAPIFMSPQMCRESNGLILCAGPKARFDRVQPALAAMTRTVWWVGERGDLAAAYKLFGNAMILTITGGLADVFQMASALGIDAQEAYTLFERFKPGMTIDVRGARMSKGDFDPSFAMTMARKDLRLMLESAGGQPLAVLPGLAERMDGLIGRGLGDRDLGALAADAVRSKK